MYRRYLIIFLASVCLVFPQKRNWSVGVVSDDYFVLPEGYPEIKGIHLSIHTPFFGINNFKFSPGALISVHNIESRKSSYGFFGLGGSLSIFRLLSFEYHRGPFGVGYGSRAFYGLSSERLNIPIAIKIGYCQLFAEHYSDNHWTEVYNEYHDWAGLSLGLTYTFGKKNSGSGSGGGPSASKGGKNQGGKIERPSDCGSAEIDNFKNAAFDLNDKIVELKEKLKGVSNGLTESNKVLSEIGNSSSGPVGWALVELQKGFSKSKNSITTAVQSLQSDIPDLPEIYFALIKESMIAPETLEELLKGTEPEEALVATFNKKAKEKGVPTTSKEWIKSLNLELDPTKALKLKLGKINEGIVGGKDKLVSVPDDLKAIGEQAKSLLASAGELPKAAKSLGFSKAPAALKSIKATTGVLKNIPNEVTAIGDESKKVMEEIDKVLKNIQSILSTT